MNASMSLNESMSLNASISLSDLIFYSSKARKQLLQMFDSEDRHIAQALKLILENLKRLSKKQRTQLYKRIQTMCDATEKNEAQAQKEIDSELSKLLNDDYN
jgi:mRNA-degrading endonuclease RelE of RelBE toxin-antitoxin system